METLAYYLIGGAVTIAIVAVCIGIVAVTVISIYDAIKDR